MNKIAIIGPESTGKTQLCKQLSRHYHSPWEAELARKYIENLNGDYSYSDVENIARLQIEQEKRYEKYLSTEPFVFFDTELIVTKVWFLHKYGKVPAFVEERLNHNFFDLYLLSIPDIPWEEDAVRENGDKRDYFFDWYENEIIKLKKPYIKIDGIGERRLKNGIEAVNSFFGLTPIKTNI